MKRTAFELTLISVLLWLAIGITPCVRFASAQDFEAIIIQADGSVEGTDKIQRNENVYTLTSDVHCSVDTAEALIFILRDNIVLDGAGYTISSEGNGIGIHMESRQNVVVKDFKIQNFGSGISFGFATNNPIMEGEPPPYILAQNNQIINNQITSYYWGITLENANATTISDNIITATNPKYGVSLGNCNFTSFFNNKLYGGSLYIGISNENLIVDNTIDGKSLTILNQDSNRIIDGAGQVILQECSNITIKNVNPSADLRVAIQLSDTNNSKIVNCSGRTTLSNSHYNILSNNFLSGIGSIGYDSQPAITLSASNFNLIFENQITKCDDEGISLTGSDFNHIYNNVVADCDVGIWLLGSKNNSLYQNILEGDNFGIKLAFEMLANISPFSYNNSIFENTINSCDQGIHLFSADENKVFRNSISNCTAYGIFLCCADGNMVYNNNFLANNLQVYEEHSVWTGMGFKDYFSENNTWDAGSTIGGNFWSNYKGIDTDGDGMGDTPYIIDALNQDNYPVIFPFEIPSSAQFPSPTPTPSEETNSTSDGFPTTLFIVSIIIVAVISVALLFYFKKRKSQAH
jgi:parallel beta-helix repeat protein